ncbi:MAG: hypothetical protein ACE5KM_04580 [Planctomycetaceae bacterium]
MPTFNRYALTSLALSYLVFGACARSQAGDKTGVAPISDALQPVPEPNPLPASFTEYRSGVVSSDGAWNGSGAGFGNSARSGDLGPEIHPIQRDPVVYQRYWPQRWYGDPRRGIPADAPRAPMVFTPTDTTQLGYYYQRAPQWQPAPWMLPRAPGPWVHQFRRCRHHGSHRFWSTSGGNIFQSAPTPVQPDEPQPAVPPGPEKTARR